MTAAVSPKADVAPAPDPPRVQHAKQVARLTQYVEFSNSIDDRVRAAAFTKELKGTAERVKFDEIAEALVTQFGFGHEVNATSIAYNDAVSFVAKTLHELSDGVRTSNYQRAHAAVAKVNDGAHVDADLMKAPWDPAADIIAHLSLEKPEHIAAVRALFTGKVV